MATQMGLVISVSHKTEGLYSGRKREMDWPECITDADKVVKKENKMLKQPELIP